MQSFAVAKEGTKWKVTVWWSPSSFDITYCETDIDLVRYIAELVGVQTVTA